MSMDEREQIDALKRRQPKRTNGHRPATVGLAERGLDSEMWAFSPGAWHEARPLMQWRARRSNKAHKVMVHTHGNEELCDGDWGPCQVVTINADGTIEETE